MLFLSTALSRARRSVGHRHQRALENSALPPSHRAEAAQDRGLVWDLILEVQRFAQYDAEKCPDGIVNLGGAINGLMKQELRAYMREYQKDVDLVKAFNYGPLAGTDELHNILAHFFNHFFSPAVAIRQSDVIATNGVTSALELLAFGICEDGDGVLFPAPNYFMLDYDFHARASVQCIPVSTSHVSDPFSVPSVSLFCQAMEAKIVHARAAGVRVRALVLCNPANPTGRSYTLEALQVLARFCGKHRLHLISDEIYALSRFKEEDASSQEGSKVCKFASALSIPDDPANGVSHENIHVLYGVSKDWSMGGLRMGFLVSRNERLLKAFTKATFFTWTTTFSVMFLTKFFGDLEFIERYVETYQGKLGAGYHLIASTLNDNHIPFSSADSGVFIFLDLSGWLHHFSTSVDGASSDQKADRLRAEEMELCRYLIDQGVFISPGQFSEMDLPGHFRLVFSEDPGAAVVGIRRIRKALDELEGGSLKIPRELRLDCVKPVNTESDAVTLSGGREEPSEDIDSVWEAKREGSLPHRERLRLSAPSSKGIRALFGNLGCMSN